MCRFLSFTVSRTVGCYWNYDCFIVRCACVCTCVCLYSCFHTVKAVGADPPGREEIQIEWSRRGRSVHSSYVFVWPWQGQIKKNIWSCTNVNKLLSVVRKFVSVARDTLKVWVWGGCEGRGRRRLDSSRVWFLGPFHRPLAPSRWWGLMTVKLLWGTSVSLCAAPWFQRLIGSPLSRELLCCRGAATGVRRDCEHIHIERVWTDLNTGIFKKIQSNRQRMRIIEEVVFILLQSLWSCEHQLCHALLCFTTPWTYWVFYSSHTHTHRHTHTHTHAPHWLPLISNWKS